MRARRAAVVGMTLLALAGCTSDGRQSADPVDASPRPSLDPAAEAAAELTRSVLEGEEVPEPLATMSGALALLQGPSAVEVDVLEVRAGATSTLLRWRLRSPATERVRTYTSTLSLPNRFDTRAVALLDEQGGQRLQPFTFIPQRNQDNPIACVCSDLPNDVGPDGLLMYGLYPPLAAGTTAVDVAIPGFATATDVEVTRP